MRFPRTSTLAGLVAGFAAGLALAPALAGQAIKQVDAGGRVTYSDQPLPDKRVVDTLRLPVMSAEEQAEVEARRASLARETELLRGRLRERSDQLDQIDLEIRLASRMLGVAQTALENGLAPQAGERTGRRLNDAYITRIAGLEQRVVDARTRLDRLYEQRNRLK